MEPKLKQTVEETETQIGEVKMIQTAPEPLKKPQVASAFSKKPVEKSLASRPVTDSALSNALKLVQGKPE